MFYVLNHLGIQSNIMTSATYSSVDFRLTNPVILAALRTVVQKHAGLWVVFVQRPSSKRGHHDLLKARLDTIDLETCVEFEHDNGKGVDAALLERLHNEWDLASDEPDKPWWKVVVKGQDIIFVCHHSVADGMGTYVFHREFLAALNAMEWPQPPVPSPAPTQIHTSAVLGSLPKDPLVYGGLHFKLWDVVCYTLLNLLLNWFLLRWIIFDSLPAARPCGRDISHPPGPESRTVSRISSLRIPASQMTRVIKACRANDTTFTPLLLILMTLTLASDHFPDAKFAWTRYAYDLRPLIDMDAIGDNGPTGDILNATGGDRHFYWLRRFRDADAALHGNIPPDGSAIWDLVREYKQEMERARHGSASSMYQSAVFLGTSLEDFVARAFGSFKMSLPRTIHVSNLGPFTPTATNSKTDNGGQKSSEKNPGPWKVEEVQFSVGATNGTVGTRGIILSGAGIRGGDTIINATYEEGIVTRERAEDVLEGLMNRLEALIALA